MRSLIDTSNIEIFPGKSMSSLLKDIYDNSVEKSGRINGLVDQLADLIKNKDHAVVLVPLIKEYLEVDISNDEMLVEVAKVVQRLESAYIRSDPETKAQAQLSDAEKDQLREIAKELRDGKEEDLKQLENKTDDSLDELDVEIEKFKDDVREQNQSDN